MPKEFIRLVDRVSAILGDIQLQLEGVAEELRRCPPGSELLELAIQVRRLQGKVDDLAVLLSAGPANVKGDEG